MADEKETCGSGSGTTFAYYVEVRYNYLHPEIIGGVAYGKDWQRIQTIPAAHGVPSPRYQPFAVAQLGLLSKAQAEAIRWLFIAHAAVDHKDLFLETRIVEVKVKYSYESEIINRSAAVERDQTP